MNLLAGSKLEHLKKTLENRDDILKEHGPYFTVGWLTGALESAVREIERLAAEQAR